MVLQEYNPDFLFAAGAATAIVATFIFSLGFPSWMQCCVCSTRQVVCTVLVIALGVIMSVVVGTYTDNILTYVNVALSFVFAGALSVGMPQEAAPDALLATGASVTIAAMFMFSLRRQDGCQAVLPHGGSLRGRRPLAESTMARRLNQPWHAAHVE